jgi:hypothetical protein
MTPATIAKIGTFTGSLIDDAGPTAERVILEVGVAPDDVNAAGGLLVVTDKFVKDKLHEYYLGTMERFYELQSLDKRDDALLGNLWEGISASAYAIGVAVGLRIAGGGR